MDLEAFAVAQELRIPVLCVRWLLKREAWMRKEKLVRLFSPGKWVEQPGD